MTFSHIARAFNLKPEKQICIVKARYTCTTPDTKETLNAQQAPSTQIKAYFKVRI